MGVILGGVYPGLVKIRNAQIDQSDRIDIVLKVQDDITVRAKSENKDIGPSTAGQQVPPGSPDQGIVSCAADDRVFSRPTIQRIAASPTTKDVIAGTSAQNVVSDTAVQPVVSCSSDDRIRTACTAQNGIIGISSQTVGQTVADTGHGRGAGHDKMVDVIAKRMGYRSVDDIPAATSHPPRL